MYIIAELFRNYYYFKKNKSKNKTPNPSNQMKTDKNISHLMREKASKAKLYS